MYVMYTATVYFYISAFFGFSLNCKIYYLPRSLKSNVFVAKECVCIAYKIWQSEFRIYKLTLKIFHIHNAGTVRLRYRHVLIEDAPRKSKFGMKYGEIELRHYLEYHV